MKTSRKLWIAILSALSLGMACALRLSAAPSAMMMIAPSYSLLQDKDRVKIKSEELPQNIRTTLGTDAYKGWTVVSAYKVKNGEMYDVELKKGDTTQAIKFDKDGKVK